jgi:hypothetical protein
MMSDISTTAPVEPKGIAGWLILPALGTFLSPLAAAYGALEILSGLGNTSISALPPGVVPFVVAEVIFNLGLMAGWIVAIVKMLKHKRSYPRLYVSLLLVTAVGSLGDLAIAAGLLDSQLGPEQVKPLIRTTISLVIWGPYMFKSKRVRNTFVVD